MIELMKVIDGCTSTTYSDDDALKTVASCSVICIHVI